MTRDEWAALAARCEAATGPSDELDAHILCGLAPEGAYVEQSRINGAWCIYHGAEYRSGRPALWIKPFRVGGWPVTASIDAITALIERELPNSLYTIRQLWDAEKKGAVGSVFTYSGATLLALRKHCTTGWRLPPHSHSAPRFAALWLKGQ